MAKDSTPARGPVLLEVDRRVKLGGTDRGTALDAIPAPRDRDGIRSVKAGPAPEPGLRRSLRDTAYRPVDISSGPLCRPVPFSHSDNGKNRPDGATAEKGDRATFGPKPRSMNRVCRRAIDARMRRFTADDIAGARANRRICP